MRKADEIVLALVRAAIGSRPEGVGLGGSDFVGVAAQEWCEVMDVAFEQGVAGIAFEAVELSFESLRMDSAQLPNLPEDAGGPDSDSLMEWFGQVEYLRGDYRQYLNVAGRFAAELEKAGVRVCVLKGLAFARYYARPEHRWSCDFDCVLSDFELGNQVAERMGGCGGQVGAEAFAYSVGWGAY